MQNRYKDKPVAPVEQKVQMAVDAAHLLSEWLDTITIELVRRGVLEPYSITAQFEEMVIHKLQAIGSKNKLTYGIVSDELDKLGEPVTIVDQYIEENNPTRKRFLTTQSNTSATQDKPSKVAIELQRRPSINTSKADQTIFYIYAFTVITLIGILILYDIFSPVTNTRIIGMGTYKARNFPLNIVIPLSLIFIGVEFYSGLNGTTFVNPEHYQVYRYLFSNSLIIYSVTRIILGSEVFLTIPRDTYNYSLQWSPILIFTITVQLTIFIRDHAPSLVPIPKPQVSLIRFLTPAYLLTGLAFIFVFIAYLIIFQDYPNYTNSLDSTTVRQSYWAFFIALALGLISIAIDTERKYKISYRRLIFVLFIPYAFLIRFVEPRDGFIMQYGPPEYNPLFPVIFFIWIALYIILILNIFENRITTELKNWRQKYQSELNKYKNYQK